MALLRPATEGLIYERPGSCNSCNITPLCYTNFLKSGDAETENRSPKMTDTDFDEVKNLLLGAVPERREEVLELL